MSDTQVAIWLAVVLLLEIPSIAFFVGHLFSDGFDGVDSIILAGLTIAAIGCMAQVYRTIHYFTLGSYPVDKYFPLWALKDIGFCVAVLRFTYLKGWKK